VIVAMHETVCFPSVYSTDQSGQIYMTVEWRLYSKSRGQVVAKVQTTAGQTVASRARAGEVLLENAFADAVDRMAASPAIRQALAAAPSVAAQDPHQPVARPPIDLAGSLAAVSHGLDSEADSVVLITAPDGGFGSGFLVSKDGYLLTDAHVVGDAKMVKIRWSDGVEAQAQVVRLAKARDVAVIWSDPRGHAPLPLRKDMPVRGDTVFAIGAPLERALQGTVMRGIVSAHRVLDGFDLLQSDVNVNHGMSGGPLLDDKGRVVALVESAYQLHENVPEGVNYFTPIGDALRYLSLTPQ
jgi:S1-C subfamily serine protease